MIEFRKGVYMGILNNLTLKLIEKKGFDFADFDKNYKKNLKHAVKEFNKMIAEDRQILKRREVYYYVENFGEEANKLKEEIQSQTGSHSFSYNLSRIITSARLYAANFLTTDKGENDKAIKYELKRMLEMIDSLTFACFTHILYERNINIDFDGNKFKLIKNSYEDRFYRMVLEAEKTICKIITGVLTGSRDEVYANYLKLSDNAMFNCRETSEEIFGL